MLKFEKKKLEYSPEWKGPLKNRSCTDNLWLAIFVAFIICWGGLGCYALTAGNLKARLVSEDDHDFTIELLRKTILMSGTILGIIAGSIVVCLVYIILLKWLALPFFILSVLVFCSFCCYLAHFKFGDYVREDDIMDLIQGLILVMTSQVSLYHVIRRFKTFRLACELIKETNTAVTSTKFALIFPLLPSLLQLQGLLYAIIVGLYLYMIEDLETWSFGLLLTAHLIGFIWFHCFIISFEELILTGIFAEWFWRKEKSDISFRTVAINIWRTTRYHLGTIALGSLLITVCHLITWSKLVFGFIPIAIGRLIGSCLNAIESSGTINFRSKLLPSFARRAIHFFKFLAVFEQFMDRNTFIICAVYGKGLFSSASDAASLLGRHPQQVTMLNNVASTIFRVGKVGISVVMIVVLWLHYINMKNEEYDWLGPMLLVGIGSFIVGRAFCNAYVIAIDTIFLCSLEDCERNDGSESKPYYCSDQLRKLLYKEAEPCPELV